MEITRDQLIDINELIADTAEFYCNENMMSGEKFYTVLECYATAKLAEIRGELAWAYQNQLLSHWTQCPIVH